MVGPRPRIWGWEPTKFCDIEKQRARLHPTGESAVRREPLHLLDFSPQAILRHMAELPSTFQRDVFRRPPNAPLSTSNPKKHHALVFVRFAHDRPATSISEQWRQSMNTYAIAPFPLFLTM
jgi:hypothetical protein